MGIFGNTSPFDADVEKATSENNTSEEWGVIMEICDKVGASTNNAKDCLRSIIRRLSNPDPHVVVQAITLLDACVNNCGKAFHLEIASREFESEFRKLLSKAQPPIAQKLKALLKKWAEGEFKTDTQLNLIPSLLSKLHSEGTDFSDLPSLSTGEASTRKKEISTGATVSSTVAAAQREEEELARAIALSLQESKTSPLNTRSTAPLTSSGGSTLYPSMDATASDSPVHHKPQKVRALYDFEAVEDNELTFLAGEIIHVIDSSDPNWWKGYNKRGEGLFPANFVTTDLSQPQAKVEGRKSVQFSETVEAVHVPEDAPVDIDESKMDRVLGILHEANPEDASGDTDEMLRLESEVYRMGPLIDQSLEKADRRHAQLTQLSADLVDALNLYHTLMREPSLAPGGPTMMKPFPQAATYSHLGPQIGPNPQHPVFTGSPSMPSMNPYYTHGPQSLPMTINGAVMPPGLPQPQQGQVPPHHFPGPTHQPRC